MKRADKPYYDSKEKCWYLDTAYGKEEGDALYIASELIRDGVCYRFHTEPPEQEKHHNHEHYFEGVVEYVLRGPEYFSIDGFENDYSEQEQRMLKKLWERMK